MTRIAVVSDSHQNLPLLEKVIEQVSSEKVDLFIHLGDDYADAKVITAAGYNLIQVPGTWRKEYLMPTIDNRRLDVIEGWRFFLSHTPEVHFNDLREDPDPQAVVAAQTCDLFLHGHTHHPKIHKEGGVTVLNPGHLKSEVDRGHPASYAILDVTPSTCHITIRTLFDARVLAQETLEKQSQ